MGETLNVSDVGQQMAEIDNQTSSANGLPQELNHWAWKFYMYGFGSIYIAFVVQVLFVLIRECKVSSEHRKQHTRVMSIELIISGTSRAALLFCNPFFIKDTDSIAHIFAKVSWSAGTILLISAFSILLVILLESTKISVGPPKFRKLSVLLSITAVNSGLLVVMRVIVTLVSGTRGVIIACHAIFSLWGLGFCLGFAVTSVRMWSNVKSSLQNPRSDSRFAEETRRLRGLLIRTVAASVLSAVMFIVTSCLAASDYVEFYSDAESAPDFWTWYGVQTSCRILELLVMFLIFDIALKAKTKQHRHSDSKISST